MVWKLKSNRKEVVDYWNDKIKKGIYAMAKYDYSTGDTYWIVRKYGTKAFGAKKVGQSKTKDGALKILNKYKKQMVKK